MSEQTTQTSLEFISGELHLKALPEFLSPMRWQKNKFTGGYSSQPCEYRGIVEEFVEHSSLKFLEDKASSYQKISLNFTKPITPRFHQQKALNKWFASKMRGVVSLPTGAGKTILAMLAMEKIGRSTLVVVPTIDLLLQWKKTITDLFGVSVGQLGGGKHEIEDITVATYDSAYLTIDKIGDRFGFLVVDECHHLPAPQNRQIAIRSIAPFRLGLSATVERSDGLEEIIFQYLGPLCYQADIQAMQSKVLSPYDIRKIEIELTNKEIEDYRYHRGIYLSFLRSKNINMSQASGWMDFIKKSSYLPGGKQAMKSYREQKNIALAASGKIDAVWKILLDHGEESTIIFTQDNAMAYKIGRKFFLAVITHKTKPKERKRMIELFRNGTIKVLVTSKVLNEGVDVPEASVGVVVSGSSVVREHVQRLGRILRHQPGKVATLYEIVAKNTMEQGVNERRRQHHAYQK